MAVKEVPRSLRLPVEVDERLSRLAAATGRSKSYYLRELVTAGIDDLEYAYGLITHAEAIRAGRRETRPLEDLMSEMDISRAELNAMPDQTA
ncbi:ribbon-helix-helix protein, CopG family [Nakamurella antarctica]|uniref:Ribbon-helix-helix protein, CopG family n=1 Tax=Nakamurella antarctica TaxID=1902245 RepID=A0A3G9A0B5_9ACTN|nr:ribbon-helix-helix protein, CopG family [Nakamurella antarctica]AZI59221.1 ribbon-helix-helix protein, CopG family [Nakamurella antarctica]